MEGAVSVAQWHLGLVCPQEQIRDLPAQHGENGPTTMISSGVGIGVE
jgi:hypothetical protein